MGLIKTAMMTGGGIYAVNRLAKTAETRHSNSQYPEQTPYPPANRTPAQYQTFAQAHSGEGRTPAEHAPPGYWYSEEFDAYYPVPRTSQGDKSGGAILSPRGVYPGQNLSNEQSVSPPPYLSQQETRRQTSSWVG